MPAIAGCSVKLISHKNNDKIRNFVVHYRVCEVPYGYSLGCGGHDVNQNERLIYAGKTLVSGKTMKIYYCS